MTDELLKEWCMRPDVQEVRQRFIDRGPIIGSDKISEFPELFNLLSEAFVLLSEIDQRR